MAGQFDALPGIGQSGPVDLQDPQIPVDEVTDIEVLPVGAEGSALRKRADIDLNDHRPAGDGETAGSLTKLLRASWDDSQAEGTRVVEHLLNLIR